MFKMAELLLVKQRIKTFSNSIMIATLTLVFCLCLNQAAATDNLHPRFRRDIQNTKIDTIKTLLNPSKEVDLILMIDSSKGMGKNAFYLKERQLFQSIVQQYAVIHPKKVLLSVIIFAKSATSPIDYISTSATTLNKCQLFSGTSPEWEKVVYMDDPNVNSGTNVLIALGLAKNILEGGRSRRPNAEQVVILATDADYDKEQHETTKAAAQELKDKNVTIFGIGAGTWLKPGNAEAIASPNMYATMPVWEELVYKTSPYTSYLPIDTVSWIWDAASALNATTFCQSGCKENSQCFADPFSGKQTCQCNAGYYPNTVENTKEEICSPCPPHNYKPDIGNHLCTICPAPGYTANDTISITESACICPPDGNGCFDECKSDPCGINAQCSYPSTNSRSCSCLTGWEDKLSGDPNKFDCTRHVLNECTNNDCQHGSTCVDMDGGFTCVCPMGYYGEKCENMKDFCKFTFCENGGTCTPKLNGVSCECTSMYTGNVCKDLASTTTTTTTTTTTPPPTTQSTTTSNVTSGTPTTPTTTTTTGAASTTTSTTPSTIAPTLAPVKDDDNLLYIIIGAAAGGGLLLIIIIIIIVACICCRRKEKEPPKEEVEANEKTDGARLYRKNRSAKQTMSNRFSDFWRKKTMRPGSFFFNDSSKGLPSVPPRRRPDLLGHMNDGFSTIESETEVEYAVMDNQQIQDTGGMDGWMRYIQDIQGSGLVEKACILKLSSKKRACSDNWDYQSSETEKLLTIMENEDLHVPSLVQNGEYHIHQNDGSIAAGKTIGSDQDPRLMVIGKTKTFLVVGIADAAKDSGQCIKEIEWITDHIKTEGY